MKGKSGKVAVDVIYVTSQMTQPGFTTYGYISEPANGSRRKRLEAARSKLPYRPEIVALLGLNSTRLLRYSYI